jgi:hypothetical protein
VIACIIYRKRKASPVQTDNTPAINENQVMKINEAEDILSGKNQLAPGGGMTN